MTIRKFLGLAAVTVPLIAGAVSSGRALGQEISAPPMTSEQLADAPRPETITTDVPQATRTVGQFWLSGDYAFSFMRGVELPALASTSPAGTPRPLAGVLGAPGTEVLFGGWQNEDLRAGFRLGAGWWFGGERNFGVEAGFVFVGAQTASFFGATDTFPILARPYIDSNSNTQQAVLVSFPGVSNGTLDIQSTVGNFYAANFNITEKAIDEGNFRVIGLVGYRYYRFDDSLSVRQNLTVTDPNFIPGTQVLTNDSFSANNEFHGFDMGFRTQHLWGNFSLELLAKLAVGELRRQINIAGDQTTFVPGLAPIVDAAGVLALSSNSGTYISHEWKVVPEAGFTLGWQLRPNLNVRVGYSFLLLNGVTRAADQVDEFLNPNLFPPPAGPGASRPTFTLNRTDVWIQSINVGVLWTY
jgi:hypothetical protein